MRAGVLHNIRAYHGFAGRGLAGGGMAALQDREMRILAFERRMWRSPGAKELQIRETFAISATRYYQLLNELIDRPEAAAFDPALVNRLRARRSRRAGRRSVRSAESDEPR
jgi:hypothetical protein